MRLTAYRPNNLRTIYSASRLSEEQLFVITSTASKRIEQLTLHAIFFGRQMEAFALLLSSQVWLDMSNHVEAIAISSESVPWRVVSD